MCLRISQKERCPLKSQEEVVGRCWKRSEENGCYRLEKNNYGNRCLEIYSGGGQSHARTVKPMDKTNGPTTRLLIRQRIQIHLLKRCVESPFSLSSAVGWGTALQVERSRVRFPMVSLEFFIDTNLPAALWPWGRLSLWQIWVPGILPICKGGRCVGLTTLPPSCADCLEIWEPQPPGTLRASPGL